MAPRRTSLATCVALACGLAACDSGVSHVSPSVGAKSLTPGGAKLPPDYVPVSVGAGPRYRPALDSPRVLGALPVGRIRCDPRDGPRYGAHLELFAYQHVVTIPAGIGLTPPLALYGASVRRARCYYPAVTTDPTGVIAVRAGSTVTLGELFDLWGQPLGPGELAAFAAPRRARVIAFVDGRRWTANPREIPLSRHTRITLELASHVLPHRVYLFPPRR